MSRYVPFLLALLPIVALAGNPPAKVKTAAAPGSATGAAPMHQAGEMTCAQMMQKTAVMPEKMSQVMTAVADMWDSHAKWVGNKDKAAKAEYDEMEKLSKDARDLADRYRKMADMMKKANFPDASHDMKSPQLASVMDSASRLATAEREMAQLMTQHASDLDQQVSKMRQGAGGD